MTETPEQPFEKRLAKNETLEEFIDQELNDINEELSNNSYYSVGDALNDTKQLIFEAVAMTRRLARRYAGEVPSDDGTVEQKLTCRSIRKKQIVEAEERGRKQEREYTLGCFTCPKCGEKYLNPQDAKQHAKKNKHWGDYKPILMKTGEEIAKEIEARVRQKTAEEIFEFFLKKVDEYNNDMEPIDEYFEADEDETSSFEIEYKARFLNATATDVAGSSSVTRTPTDKEASKE